MKILLFGKNGQIGWELNRSLKPLGEIIALGREDVDVSNPETLREIIHEASPDLIVNAVAYTAVDKAEEEEELAAIVNGVVPGVLAEEAFKIKALLVHYSTDYVFDGAKEGEYLESDAPNPINAYGRTKLAGEVAVQSSGCDYLIFRTAWVYASRGHNFLLTILRLAKEREELNIVTDQYGAPTSAKLISETTVECVRQAMEQKNSGKFSSEIYHLTASGKTSWFGFSEEIIRLARNNLKLSLKLKELKPIPSTEYQTPAKRPINSLLVLKKLERQFSVKLPDWKESLQLCLQDLPEE